MQKAVLTLPDSTSYTGEQWEKAFDEIAVYCQWNPDRNINGNAINRAAIQIGLKGNTLRNFLNQGICHIEDLTPLIIKWNEQRKNGKLNDKNLPVAKLYLVKDSAVKKRSNMI